MEELGLLLLDVINWRHARRDTRRHELRRLAGELWQVPFTFGLGSSKHDSDEFHLTLFIWRQAETETETEAKLKRKPSPNPNPYPHPIPYPGRDCIQGRDFLSSVTNDIFAFPLNSHVNRNLYRPSSM